MSDLLAVLGLRDEKSQKKTESPTLQRMEGALAEIRAKMGKDGTVDDSELSAASRALLRALNAQQAEEAQVDQFVRENPDTRVSPQGVLVAGEHPASSQEASPSSASRFEVPDVPPREAARRIFEGNIPPGQWPMILDGYPPRYRYAVMKHLDTKDAEPVSGIGLAAMDAYDRTLPQFSPEQMASALGGANPELIQTALAPYDDVYIGKVIDLLPPSKGR